LFLKVELWKLKPTLSRYAPAVVCGRKGPGGLPAARPLHGAQITSLRVSRVKVSQPGSTGSQNVATR
jgi:hypothetical protein